MKAKLEERLEALKAEYASGQKMLAEIDTRRATLTQAMLRIEGAMQVLQEMLEHPSPEAGPDATPRPPAS
ncbi:hypothetical protein [Vitiosangium sp. GDMCC 1.1324]|uniref:hypothetical protein n=1 Tax=Vitiosangium sp. (strain GDMCC 1.1324) TaxID=2138576 RepID=UPI000D36DF3E|nr:hypothetical protein [Vitiosangium sp. GDMCC 1.1324]PTL80170.1 hypothetical protein DAT35_29605 [Vitiosangium sp. GDMCC 1.1324]